ncbi:MAG: tail fiber domain-containing protein [Phycisphaerales bacterium]|nr:tail fiber domain-containing protein [Phycisphaerales bacterium]
MRCVSHVVVMAFLVSASALVFPARGQSFSNPTPLAIPDNGPASLYPSPITVSGVTDPVASVVVTINGLTHTYPSDLVIVLVSPSGQATALSGRCGDSADVNNLTLSFSPDASAPLTGATPVSGTYLPSACSNAASLPLPGPQAPYSVNLLAALGTGNANVNGQWQLFVADLAPQDIGSVAGGWSIAFTTSPAASPSSSTAFTYQGQLKDGPGAVNGPAAVRFKLFDAPTGGAGVGAPFAVNASVDNGLFTALVDFGATPIDAANARWMAISVNGTTLSPRQRLTPSPTAVEARSALVADAAILADNTRGISVDAQNRVGIAGAAIPEATFCVRSAEVIGPDQQNLGPLGSASNAGTLSWQSFVPAVNGRLTAVESTVGNAFLSGSNNVTMTIYAGEGVGGAVLSQAQFTLTPGENTASNTSRKVYTLTNEPLLVAGQTYTFAYSAASGGLFVRYSGNTYPAGISNNGSADVIFVTQMNTVGVGNAALVVANSGRVGINVTIPTQALHVAGNILANNVAVPSSGRFKHNVLPMSGALDKLLKLDGVTFDWNAEFAKERPGREHDIGFVAEDVAKVFPEVVFYDAEGKVTGMDYSRLTAVAVAAIKQQQALRNADRAELDALKADAAKRDAENAELKARLAAIEAALLKLNK